MAATCEHLKDLSEQDFPPPKTPNACEDCLREGTTWVELRECKICGHVGCCDSSPGKHATRHFHETQHPVMRSVMPGAKWTWCYVHEVQGETAAGLTENPDSFANAALARSRFVLFACR